MGHVTNLRSVHEPAAARDIGEPSRRAPLRPRDAIPGVPLGGRTRGLVRWALLATSVVLGTRDLSAADDPVAKEFAALEEAFETAPLDWPSQYAAFQPKYEAFAKAHPGTEAALAAKMRLLQFTATIKDDKEKNAEAVRRFNDVFADDPRTPRFADVPGMWHLFSPEDFGRIWQLLSQPDQPDAVKAALLLYDAHRARQQKEFEPMREKAYEIADKYGSVQRGEFTFGQYAKALLELHEPQDLAVDAVAPDIVATAIDGKPVKLSALRGRVVLLCFFNGGFGSRKDTYADEKALAQTFKAEKFSMLFISSTSSSRRARAVAKTEKLTWPIVFDGRDGPIAVRWGIDAWPKWYLIDHAGVIRRVDTGQPATWTTGAILELLAETPKRKK